MLCGRARPRPGDLKGGAVIGAGARVGEPEGDVHPFIEGEELERDQSLIVVHADDAVELALRGADERRYRARKGPRRRRSRSASTAGAMISISSRPSTPDSPA